MKHRTEKADTPFSGTIIDFETIGEFCKFPDSRAYKDLRPVMVGALYNGELHIHYIEKENKIESFIKELIPLLDSLPKPWYALNCGFEQGVTFHSCGIIHLYDHELQARAFESKKKAVQILGINNYDDPFEDIGKLFLQNWLNGNIDECLKHNRSCLLKERDILIKRGYTKPEEMKFVPYP